MRVLPVCLVLDREVEGTFLYDTSGFSTSSIIHSQFSTSAVLDKLFSTELDCEHSPSDTFREQLYPTHLDPIHSVLCIASPPQYIFLHNSIANTPAAESEDHSDSPASNCRTSCHLTTRPRSCVRVVTLCFGLDREAEGAFLYYTSQFSTSSIVHNQFPTSAFIYKLFSTHLDCKHPLSATFRKQLYRTHLNSTH